MLLMTFLLTILVDLVVAVNIGVVFSTLFFMRRMAKTVQIEHDTPEMLQHEHLGVEIPKNVSVYSIEGPFFFGAITAFQSALSAVHPDVKAIIIRLRHVPFIDVTAMDSLRTFTGESERNGVHVVFCEANALVQARLSRAHLTDFSRNEHFERSLEDAVAIAEQKAALAV
ncbi:MAG: SulP family inorganic anion transporter [Opitutales bacterium]|nr:SulP family inorganic anion transporter [Opitutales bacterium]